MDGSEFNRKHIFYSDLLNLFLEEFIQIFFNEKSKNYFSLFIGLN